MPRLNGRRITRAPCARATSAVRSAEPSSTTTISKPGSKARISSTTRPMHASSLRAGTIATRRLARRPSRAAGRASVAVSATRGLDRLRRLRGQPEEIEHASRAVRVGVLVERALAGAAPQLVRGRRVGEELAVQARRLVLVVRDEQLLPRLEPALDALVGVRDDRGAGHRELERPRRRGGEEPRVGAPREVQVDPRRGDGAVEGVEGDVADEARAAGVALEVVAAEGEVDLREAPARLADERAHPVAPELVAVAVEEDVRLLLDPKRPEELRVGGPEDGLGAAGAELLEPGQAALGVREHEVVLGRIGAVVVVEARVHSSELRQAHRHVAVVEDDRDAEALAQVRRDPAQVAHRNSEDDDRCDIALALEDPLHVALPARGDDAPDELALKAVGVAGVGLGPAQVAVAFEPGGEVADAGVGLALAVGGVGLGAPPGALDR